MALRPRRRRSQPPPPALLASPSPVFLTKVRWNAASFVPTTLAETILTGQKVLADQWAPDPESACLLRRDRPSTTPFRTVLRTGAAVDRITHHSSNPHTFAGVEFEPGAGLWTVVRFADEAAAENWSERLKGIFRLLADTGLGGRRSIGWGQVQALEFEDGRWPGVLFPKLARSMARNDAHEESGSSSLHWLLSLFAPAPTDVIDWSGGDYQLLERNSTGGRKVRLVAEGSVLAASTPPTGAAVDVAEDAAHPVYKSGIALALKLPAWPEPSTEEAAVEPAPEPEPSFIEPVPPAETEPGESPVSEDTATEATSDAEPEASAPQIWPQEADLAQEEQALEIHDTEPESPPAETSEEEPEKNEEEPGDAI